MIAQSARLDDHNKSSAYTEADDSDTEAIDSADEITQPQVVSAKRPVLRRRLIKKPRLLNKSFIDDSPSARLDDHNKNHSETEANDTPDYLMADSRVWKAP